MKSVPLLNCQPPIVTSASGFTAYHTTGIPRLTEGSPLREISSNSSDHPQPSKGPETTVLPSLPSLSGNLCRTFTGHRCSPLVQPSAGVRSDVLRIKRFQYRFTEMMSLPLLLCHSFTLTQPVYYLSCLLDLQVCQCQQYLKHQEDAVLCQTPTVRILAS